MPVQVKVDCPRCTQSYRVRSDKLGQRISCKKCGAAFVLSSDRPEEITEKPVEKSQPKPSAGENSATVARSPKGSGASLTGRTKGVAIACVIGISLLSLAFMLNGQRSTSATSYTSAEVREIFDLLRNDPACRDTRLDNRFDSQNISLELLDAVLGQPVSKAGSYPHLVWTYRTDDGSATITPSAVYKKQLQGSQVPYMEMKGSVQIVGLNTEKPVDREALKQTIIEIKSRFDERDGVKFQSEIAQRRDERRAADDELIKQQGKDADAEMIRAAKERALSNGSRRKAESDFYDHIRDYFPRSSQERATLLQQEKEWIDRRAKAIAEKWKADERWAKLAPEGGANWAANWMPDLSEWDTPPLPSKESVSSAISSGKPIPVSGNESNGAGTAHNPKTSPPPTGDSQPETAVAKTNGGTNGKPTPRTKVAPSSSPATVPNAETTGKPSATRLPSRTAIHRINTGRKHIFYSGERDALNRLVRANRAWKLDGIIGYGLAESTTGAVPLYRYSRARDNRHTYLIADQKPVSGFKRDGGPMLWVWQSHRDGTVPLFLLGAPKRDIRTLAAGKVERDRLVGTGEWREHRKLGYVYQSATGE